MVMDYERLANYTQEKRIGAIDIRIREKGIEMLVSQSPLPRRRSLRKLRGAIENCRESHARSADRRGVSIPNGR